MSLVRTRGRALTSADLEDYKPGRGECREPRKMKLRSRLNRDAVRTDHVRCNKCWGDIVKNHEL